MPGLRILTACSLVALPSLASAEPDMGELTSHLAEGYEVEGTLRVAAQYSDTEFRIHYEFETDSPSWYHQVWRRESGDWVRYGAGAGGPDEHGLYEDRISMLLDDGSVDGFSRYGGWMTAHEGMCRLDSAVPADAVREHPTLGEEMGRSDVRKYLNATREVDDEAEVSWDRLRDDAEIEAMRDRGE